MANSVECWQNTISKVSPYHQGKSSATYLPPIKDALVLRPLGVISIPCECGKVYIGQAVNPFNSE